jgi:hypothetical protein
MESELRSHHSLMTDRELSICWSLPMYTIREKQTNTMDPTQPRVEKSGYRWDTSASTTSGHRESNFQECRTRNWYVPTWIRAPRDMPSLIGRTQIFRMCKYLICIPLCPQRWLTVHSRSKGLTMTCHVSPQGCSICFDWTLGELSTVCFIEYTFSNGLLLSKVI